MNVHPTPRRPGRFARCAAATLLAASAALHARPLDVGDPVTFAAMTTADDFRQAHDYRGRLLVVHFWASWHPPSVAHFETLQHAVTHTSADGVRLLGVCLDDLARRDAAESVIARFHPDPELTGSQPGAWEHTFSRLQTPPLDTRFFDEAYPIPTCWLIGPDGAALWQGHPADLPAQLQTQLVALADQLNPDDTATADTTDATDPPDPDTPTTTAATDDDDGGFAFGGPDDTAPEATVDSAKAALLNAEDARLADPPDFDAVLAALASIDARLHTDPLIAAHGQRWRRLLSDLNADGQTLFVAARDADPAAGLSVDRFLQSTARIDAMEGQAPADAARVELKMNGARRDRERGRDLDAYDDFVWAVTVARGTPVADDALIAVLRYEADDEFMALFAAAEAESQAQAKLSMANGYIVSFNEDQAEVLLREILADFPNTDAAKEAKKMLDELR